MPTTTKIMVIRHAERPPNGEPNVMPDGTQNPEALTAKGWKPAEALVGLFAPPNAHFTDPHLATPQTIFASGVGSHSKSLRPQQTVTATAKKVALEIKTQHLKGEESALVQAATTVGGIVLIAWEHEAIPEIAELICGSKQGIPKKWPGDRYDLVWVFDRGSATGSWSFTQVPQLLFRDDSADSIPVKSS